MRVGTQLQPFEIEFKKIRDNFNGGKLKSISQFSKDLEEALDKVRREKSATVELKTEAEKTIVVVDQLEDQIQEKLRDLEILEQIAKKNPKLNHTLEKLKNELNRALKKCRQFHYSGTDSRDLASDFTKLRNFVDVVVLGIENRKKPILPKWPSLEALKRTNEYIKYKSDELGTRWSRYFSPELAIAKKLAFSLEHRNSDLPVVNESDIKIIANDADLYKIFSNLRSENQLPKNFEAVSARVYQEGTAFNELFSFIEKQRDALRESRALPEEYIELGLGRKANVDDYNRVLATLEWIINNKKKILSDLKGKPSKRYQHSEDWRTEKSPNKPPVTLHFLNGPGGKIGLVFDINSKFFDSTELKSTQNKGKHIRSGTQSVIKKSIAVVYNQSKKFEFQPFVTSVTVGEAEIARRKVEAELSPEIAGNPFIIPTFYGGEYKSHGKNKMVSFSPRANCGDLLDYLDSKEDRPDAINILSIVYGWIAGLMLLHGKGILHRDLKPENILLRRIQINVRNYFFGFIADFGLAIKVSELGEQNSYVGTLHYMAIDNPHVESLFETFPPTLAEINMSFVDDPKHIYKSVEEARNKIPFLHWLFEYHEKYKGSFTYAKAFSNEKDDVSQLCATIITFIDGMTEVFASSNESMCGVILEIDNLMEKNLISLNQDRDSAKELLEKFLNILKKSEFTKEISKTFGVIADFYGVENPLPVTAKKSAMRPQLKWNKKNDRLAIIPESKEGEIEVYNSEQTVRTDMNEKTDLILDEKNNDIPRVRPVISDKRSAWPRKVNYKFNLIKEKLSLYNYLKQVHELYSGNDVTLWKTIQSLNDEFENIRSKITPKRLSVPRHLNITWFFSLNEMMDGFEKRLNDSIIIILSKYCNNKGEEKFIQVMDRAVKEGCGQMKEMLSLYTEFLPGIKNAEEKKGLREDRAAEISICINELISKLGYTGSDKRGNSRLAKLKELLQPTENMVNQPGYLLDRQVNSLTFLICYGTFGLDEEKTLGITVTSKYGNSNSLRRMVADKLGLDFGITGSERTFDQRSFEEVRKQILYRLKLQVLLKGFEKEIPFAEALAKAENTTREYAHLIQDCQKFEKNQDDPKNWFFAKAFKKYVKHNSNLGFSDKPLEIKNEVPVLKQLIFAMIAEYEENNGPQRELTVLRNKVKRFERTDEISGILDLIVAGDKAKDKLIKVGLLQNNFYSCLFRPASSAALKYIGDRFKGFSLGKEALQPEIRDSAGFQSQG